MFCAGGTPIVFLFLILNLPSAELDMMDFGKCNQPLGMADGRIKDKDINITSSLDPKHELSTARLGHRDKEGRITAWCPLYSASFPQNVLEYMELELTKEHLITRVERRLLSEHGIGLKDTYPSAMIIDYYRPKIDKWRPVTFKNILTKDDSSLRPFRATNLRVGFHFLLSNDETKYCLQVEFYGCPVSDGIISYDIKGSSLPLPYANYDGNVGDKVLSKGLGGLVDGNFGDQFLTENNDLTAESVEASDNGWIGWNTKSLDNGLVEFIFEFDGVRQFFEMVVYALNINEMEAIRPFLYTKVHFSNDSKNYGDDYSFKYYSNKAAPQIQNISVSLKQERAQYLKIQFFLDTNWMFISEITFNSSLVEAKVLQNTDETKKSKVPSSRKPWSSQRTWLILLAIFIGLLISLCAWLIIKLRRTILTNRLNNTKREEKMFF